MLEVRSPNIKGKLFSKKNNVKIKTSTPGAFAHLEKHHMGRAVPRGSAAAGRERCRLTPGVYLAKPLKGSQVKLSDVGPGGLPEPRVCYLSSSRRAEMVLRVGPFSFFASACAIW